MKDLKDRSNQELATSLQIINQMIEWEGKTLGLFGQKCDIEQEIQDREDRKTRWMERTSN